MKALTFPNEPTSKQEETLEKIKEDRGFIKLNSTMIERGRWLIEGGFSGAPEEIFIITPMGQVGRFAEWDGLLHAWKCSDYGRPGSPPLYFDYESEAHEWVCGWI